MNRIKELRTENNWSQAELATRLQCAMSSVAMYEKEERKPSLEVLVKLSEIFDCTIDYLLCKSDIRNPETINFDSDKLYIGLSAKDYNMTDEKRKQIEDFAKFVLADNKKDKDKKEQ